MRAYLAPLGVAVAERLRAAWMTLDLDEDDARLAQALGDASAAAGYDRLLAAFGAAFDGLCAASGVEALSISSRHGMSVEHLPNAVDVPAALRPTPSRSGDEHVSLLFVGNLTYPPNIRAARVLVEQVLPRVQRRLRHPIRVTLVGHHRPALRRLGQPGVELTGFVNDLAPLYAAADAVVVPLGAGGGTRIKLLEAFAHRVPVVCTGAAAAGLEVAHGRHLLLADTPDDAAAAIERLVRSPPLAATLVQEAERLVRSRYSIDAVGPEIGAFFARAAARAGARDHLSVPP
jgi:glycosyltransferase involved in cell wall biosynthesis